jgi:hypothetical protein
MKKYRIHLLGTKTDKIIFYFAFTVACLSVVLLPLGILMLIQNVEIQEHNV